MSIRWITNNLLLKALSLAVAVVLWLAVQGDSDTTTMVAVRMQYRNIPPQMEISSELAETAFLELRGPTARLNAINLNNAAIALDLSAHQRPGERTYSITADTAKLPPGVSFLRAVPSQARIRLEPRVSKEVRVMAHFADLPDGYVVSAQDVNPYAVKITGPESHVNSIDRVQTDQIEVALSGGSDQVLATPVYTGDPMVHFEQKTVMVQVKVKIEKSR